MASSSSRPPFKLAKSASSARPQIPFSAEAERALLGALIQEPAAFHQLDTGSPLTQEHFFVATNGVIFAAIAHLMGQGIGVDFISLLGELQNTERYGERIRDEYVLGLMERAPLTENISYHAEIIKNTSTLRHIITTCEQMRHQAAHQSTFDDIGELLGDIDKSLFQLRAISTAVSGLVPGAEVLMSTVEAIERRMNQQGVPGIPSGFYDLDEVLGGFQKSDLTILAARPGMGKTALALNWVVHALGCGKKVAVFSLEMSKEQLMERILAAEGKIDAAKMRRGELGRSREMNQMVKALKEVNQYVTRLVVDETPSISLSQLVSRCRRYHAERGLDMVVVDYLQLMVGSKDLRRQGREREVSEISMGLKALAKELGVPVVAVAQLNRSPDARQDKRPRISDLRESGSMEQDADQILFIYRDEYYDKNSEQKGQAEVIIGKNRHGPLKTVTLAYVPNYVSFRNLALTMDGAKVLPAKVPRGRKGTKQDPREPAQPATPELS